MSHRVGAAVQRRTGTEPRRRAGGHKGRRQGPDAGGRGREEDDCVGWGRVDVCRIGPHKPTPQVDADATPLGMAMQDGRACRRPEEP